MDEQNKILIVEDEILVATSIKKYLQDFGYEVINIVASGSKALSVLRENQVNMVLMDIRIKGDIDGIETSAKINELYNLPIVYLTAHTDPKTLERAKKTEPYGYIVKPIEPRNMLSTIEMALYKHKAEGVIKESEERYRTLVEGAGQAIFTVDKDGICLFMNHIAEVKFNESSKPILGKCITNILPQDLAKPLIGLVKDTFKTLKPQITEATCYTDHHQEYYEIKIHPLKNKAGQFDSAMIIAADLSERKKTEKERIRLAKAVEQAAECIIITDKDFKIQYVNPAFEFITGYKRDEVLGKKPNILKSGKHDNTFYKDLYTTITSGNIWHGHFINMKKDNTLYEEEATISPVKDQSGHITNYVAVKRDVTEEIKLEKQLQRAQKLEAIGRLAGGIAHDFNNIINVISAHTELTLLDVEKETELYENLAVVLTATKRATDLVSKIMTFSRDKKEVRKPIKIQPIITEVMHLIKASLPDNVKLKRTISHEDICILADPTEVHQVLMNLCTNAIQAMVKKGGKLALLLETVKLEKKSLAAEPQITPGTYAKIEISDTGCGMDAETLDLIFEPFFTTKKSEKGTGMGLAVVHGIVHGHKGFIAVESVVGAGSTFKIYFPVV